RDDRGGVAGRFALAARGRGLYDTSSPPPGGRRRLQSPIPAGPVRSRPDRSPDPRDSERDGGLRARLADRGPLAPRGRGRAYIDPRVFEETREHPLRARAARRALRSRDRKEHLGESIQPERDSTVLRRRLDLWRSCGLPARPPPGRATPAIPGPRLCA